MDSLHCPYTEQVLLGILSISEFKVHFCA